MKFPVQYKINRLRAMNLLIFPLLIGVCTLAILGDGGILHGYSARMRLKALSHSVIKVESQNRFLKRQIELAQKNPRIAQQLIAQNTLWTPPGSTIYRFEDIENTESKSEGIGSSVKEELNLILERIGVLTD